MQRPHSAPSIESRPPRRAGATPDATPSRSDGVQSRERLLQTALALFSAQGFARTSTRELAEAAQVNIAAISYYFGDKAGLYRAVLRGPKGSVEDELARFEAPGMSLTQSLQGLYTGLLAPLQQGDAQRQCMKLHMREMLEPSGLWTAEVREGIQPLHDGLMRVLCRHLGVKRADDDVRRLAVCLAGIGLHLRIGADVIDVLAPQLRRGPQAHGLWIERLVMMGEAMVAAEAQRRRLALAAPAPATRTRHTAAAKAPTKAAPAPATATATPTTRRTTR